MYLLCWLYIMKLGDPKTFRNWVCWVHHVTGMWVYPFLEHIGPGARILFFGSTTILMNFLYLLGEVLNSYIWDTQRSMEEEKEKPKLE
ncbi:hypothetical protein MG293_010599 [Ovis ammon polii]|uniref:Androgen-induced gene 1 protein n=1 Tax=Ovis ammon polii TaxID=230172 RepID=A0AAD4U3J1_OVIAM|nr:hypothetical protein MG293_010599 [Ovis ammon polii]